MLTLGITIMVVSIVIGILALSSVALMSSLARSAGRRARTGARTALARTQGLFDHGAAGEGEPYHRAERSSATAHAVGEDPPRWVLSLAILSGAGLVLGLLMVMVASIP